MVRRSFEIGLLLIALPALASAATPAPPPVAPPPGGPLLTQLFLAPSGEPFRAAAGAPYPIVNWFAGADTNHDGKLTSTEFVIDMTRYFNVLDVDHDENLSTAEIKRYEDDIAPEVRTGDYSAIDWNVGGGGTKGTAKRQALGLMQVETDDLQAHVPEIFYGRRKPIAGMGGSQYGIIAIPQPVKAMDTDLNGIVSRREMLSAAQRRFRLLDTEERNYLVLAELPEPWAQGHQPKVKRKR